MSILTTRSKPIRKLNRLPIDQIYISNNSFFITICVANRHCFLSKIENNEVELMEIGKIVEEIWLNLPIFFENILLEDYVIMPNHFHGIITFVNTPKRISNGQNVDLSEIIRTFKAKSTRLIKQFVGAGFIRPESHNNYSFTSGSINASPTIETNNEFWQKSFYDHVIRDEQDLFRIQEYIQNNPIRWHLDLLNPSNKYQFEKWVHKKDDLRQKTNL